jgi:hypothetical protein
MSRKKSDRSESDLTGVESPSESQARTDPMSAIPDFTPEQWEWLKEESRRFENDYVPTRSLIPGL